MPQGARFLRKSTVEGSHKTLKEPTRPLRKSSVEGSHKTFFKKRARDTLCDTNLWDPPDANIGDTLKYNNIKIRTPTAKPQRCIHRVVWYKLKFSGVITLNFKMERQIRGGVLTVHVLS